MNLECSLGEYMNIGQSSGSIAIACDVFGFDLTAFEIDKEYIEGATYRLIRHRTQGVLDF